MCFKEFRQSRLIVWTDGITDLNSQQYLKVCLHVWVFFYKTIYSSSAIETIHHQNSSYKDPRLTCAYQCLSDTCFPISTDSSSAICRSPSLPQCTMGSQTLTKDLRCIISSFFMKCTEVNGRVMAFCRGLMPLHIFLVLMLLVIFPIVALLTKIYQLHNQSHNYF